MMRCFISLVPRGIAGQIVALVVCGVLVFHPPFIVFFRLFHERPPNPAAAMAERLTTVVQMLDRATPLSRSQVLQAANDASPSFAFSLLPAGETGELGHNDRAGQGGLGQGGLGQGALGQGDILLHDLTRRLGPELKPFVLSASSTFRAKTLEPRHRRLAVILHDGSAVVATIPSEGFTIGGPPPLVLFTASVGLIATILTGLLWWGARALTAPLARFASAAGEFSLDRDPLPLPEDSGPDEVRTASRALNRMQARIRSMIENRTRMLAAVSHDLRTPITRMRLRAEFIDGDDTRRQMVADLDQMDRMVHAALSYLRDGASSHRRELLDIAALTQTICNDFSDLGGAVAYAGPGRLLARGNSDELQRAVTNLVDNALKHGGNCARVRLQTLSESEIAIDVLDEGPGIPDECKKAMLEPFARGDPSRSLNESTGGFGLGLAIVKAAAEAHGGELLLLDALPCGLHARLQLPVRAERMGKGSLDHALRHCAE
jgi:signal transduction histidine kinase